MNNKWQVYLRQFNSPPQMYENPYQKPTNIIYFECSNTPQELFDMMLEKIKSSYGNFDGKLSLNDFSQIRFATLIEQAWDETFPGIGVGSLYTDDVSYGVFIESVVAEFEALCIQGKAYFKGKSWDTPIEIRTSLTRTGRELLRNVKTDEFHVESHHVGIVSEKTSHIVSNFDDYDIILDKTTLNRHIW